MSENMSLFETEPIQKSDEELSLIAEFENLKYQQKMVIMDLWTEFLKSFMTHDWAFIHEKDNREVGAVCQQCERVTTFKFNAILFPVCLSMQVVEDVTSFMADKIQTFKGIKEVIRHHVDGNPFLSFGMSERVMRFKAENPKPELSTDQLKDWWNDLEMGYKTFLMKHWFSQVANFNSHKWETVGKYHYCERCNSTDQYGYLTYMYFEPCRRNDVIQTELM